jgi:hypothetical protein
MTPAKSASNASSGGELFGLIVLLVVALGFAGAGLFLGTESRLVLRKESDQPNDLAATATNNFAGLILSQTTIRPVTLASVDSEHLRSRRPDDAPASRRRRGGQLTLSTPEGAEIRWDREADMSAVEGFLHDTAPALLLVNSPPLWRMVAAWLLVGSGGLTVIGAIRNLFACKHV